jgi:hypothetical protein
MTGWGARTHLWPVAAGHRSWRQPDPGGAGKGGSSLDNAGTGQHRQMARVRQARRRGVRVQKPVVEPPQEVDRLEPGGCGPGWQCAGPPYNRGEQPRRHGGAGGHGEVLRGSRGQACRGKAGHPSRQTVCGERGNRPRVASPPAGQAGGGKARRLLMIRVRGGGSVVVRGRESRLHGEGTQRVRDVGTGRSGGRW